LFRSFDFCQISADFLAVFPDLVFAGAFENIAAQLGAIAFQFGVIFAQLGAALLYLFAGIPDGLGVISSYHRSVDAGAMIERAVFSNVNYLGLALPMVTGAVMIMGVTVVIAPVAVMMMVMTGLIALVAVIMVVMTTSGWRTVGMRAPTAMFVVAVMMLAFTVTASFIIIVISLGRRQWSRQNQRASQKSCQGQSFRKFHLCSPSHMEHRFAIHAPSFIEIVQSAEQPTCHRVFGPNPLILPRLIAWLPGSQPVKITCGERNCSVDQLS
jgi:hypothetical protein